MNTNKLEACSAHLKESGTAELIMPAWVSCALLGSHPLVDIMVQLLQGCSDDTTPTRRACGDRYLPGNKVLRDAARDGRLGSFSWSDKIDGRWTEAERIDLAWGLFPGEQ